MENQDASASFESVDTIEETTISQKKTDLSGDIDETNDSSQVLSQNSNQETPTPTKTASDNEDEEKIIFVSSNKIPSPQDDEQDCLVNTAVTLLKEWKAPEEIIQIVIDNEIPLSALQYYTRENIIAFFFSNLKLHKYLSKFLYNFESWKKEVTVSKDSESRVQRSKDSSDDEMISLHGTTIKDILHSTSQGLDILSQYGKKQCLNIKQQNLLTRLVCKYIEENDIEPTRNTQKTLSEMIEKEFPNERKDVYYKYNNRCYSGKLPERFKNIRRKQTKSDNAKSMKSKNIHQKTDDNKLTKRFNKTKLVEKKVSENQVLQEKLTSEEELLSSTIVSENASSSSNGSSELSPNSDLALLLMKNRHLEKSKVMILWQSTTKLRSEQYYMSNLKRYQILNLLVYLKEPYAAELIEIDFEHAYPGKANLLYQKWDSFSEKMDLKIKEDKMSYRYPFLEPLRKADITDDSTKILTLLAVFTYIKTSGGKGRKLTIKEAAEGFLDRSKSVQQFEDSLVESVENAIKDKTTIQPRIHIIGDYNKIESIFVVFENYKYQFKSFLNALTFCFHVYIIFDLEYQKDNSNLWIFVQRYFFDINFDSINTPTAVKSFINDLENSQIIIGI